MKKKCLVLILGLASNIFLLCSCADDQARAQIADTNARLAKLQGNVGVIDNKVSDQKMIDVLNRLDNLQNQIDQLNGSVSTISSDQKNYQATQEQLYQSIEQQIQGLQQATGQKVTSPARVVASSVSSERKQISASSPSVSRTQASGDLKSALRKIKSRNFSQAIKELKNIIDTSDDPKIVSNATYYLTVTYAANNQYKDAIATGRKYAEDYPDSPNAPDALRTVYISQKQLGMKQSASKTANQIIQKYPNSDAAKKIKAETNKSSVAND